MKSLETNYYKAFLLLIFFFLAAVHARGEETYNFYFQQAPQKKEAKEPVQIIQIKESSKKDMPDHWDAPQRKRYFIRRQKQDMTPVTPVTPVTSESKVTQEKPKPKKDLRRWAVSVGFGTVSGQAPKNYSHSPTSGFYNESFGQRTYVLGAKYYMSRYFDVHANLHLPIQVEEESGYNYNYDYTNSSYYSQNEYEVGTEGSIGIGVTPLHISIFGGEFLELGLDGGVMFGRRPDSSNTLYMGYSTAPQMRSTASVYLGPRLGINIGSRFAVNFNYKFDTQYSKFSHSAMSVAFKW